MNIMEFLGRRHEFEHHPQCVACGHRQTMLEFTTYTHLRDGQGKLSIDVSAISAQSDPHLIVRCGVCGLEWEMECWQC